MARKQIPRTLPLSRDVFDGFKSFDERESKQLVITNMLRSVARRFRTQKSRAFYTMRDVAEHFSVPLRTVALAYERLEHEGLLTRIRGSHTAIAGKDLSPTNPVRAVVGIPLWLHAMVVSPFSRLLHIELGERLRAHGFVADIIFFREEELDSPDFADRMLMHKLDVAIWCTPHAVAMQTLLRLRDRGVRQILVVPSDNLSSIALPTYLQDWQSGYHTFAKAWYEKGIRHVIAPEPTCLPSRRAINCFASTLEAHGLQVEYVKGDARSLQAVLKRRGPGVSGLAFLDQLRAEVICNEDPVIIEEILQSSRVAFCRGSIRLPYFDRRNASVDFLDFSAREVAARLVDDLKKDLSDVPNPIHRFRPKYHESVPFSMVVDKL